MTRALILAAALFAAGGTKSAIPRTADGHPDLQGTWDNATVTPLERPKEFAEQPYFTEAEAAEFVAHGLDRFIAARGEEELKVNGEINGIWSGPARVGPSLRTSIVIDPPDGRLPALTPETQARITARLAERREHPFDNPEDLTLGERCLMWGAGPPMMPVPQNSNLQIVQTREHVVFETEMVHEARIVPLDGRPHLPAAIRQLTGDSRGHWERDTLVVETTNFTAKTELRGTTAERHVVERFTMTNADTIQYRFTVDDPAAFARPWTGEVYLVRAVDRIFEYACHEANYSMELILRGARAQEKR